MSGDAPHDEPVTVPHHLYATAELNATARLPLNSKRHHPFRSTAIERNPMSGSDCGPQEGERGSIEVDQSVPSDAECPVTLIDVDARVDQSIERLPQPCRPP